MNPTDHAGRVASPFIERAESVDVVTDVFALQSTAVPAASVVEAFGEMPSVLPRRHRRMSWAARQWARFRAVAS